MYTYSLSITKHVTPSGSSATIFAVRTSSLFKRKMSMVLMKDEYFSTQKYYAFFPSYL